MPDRRTADGLVDVADDMRHHALLPIACLLATALPALPGHAGAVHREMGGQLVGLVTVPDLDQMVAVSLPDGRVLRRFRVPEPVAIRSDSGIVAVVTSPRVRVTLLPGPSLSKTTTFNGFRTPHPVAMTPDGEYAYVTDAGSGRLSVIEFSGHRTVSSMRVGAGPGRVTVSPAGPGRARHHEPRDIARTRRDGVIPARSDHRLRGVDAQSPDGRSDGDPGDERGHRDLAMT